MALLGIEIDMSASTLQPLWGQVSPASVIVETKPVEPRWNCAGRECCSVCNLLDEFCALSQTAVSPREGKQIFSLLMSF